MPYADLGDPQSLNQYAYVRNNPMSYGDADGHDCPTCPPVTIPEATPANVQKTLNGVQKATQAAEEGAVAGEEVAARGAGRFLGPFAGVALVVGEMVFPESVESGDVPAPAFVPRVAAQPGQLGQARGAGEEHSQSDDAQDKARTNGGLVKPDKGPGSVPKDQRDPKHGATDKDKVEMRKEQNGNCAHCNKPMGDEKGIGSSRSREACRRRFKDKACA